MLYEILKTSKLGASFAPDMYTALWAQKLARDGEVKTLSGAPPLSFQANGTPLLDYLISGNTVQSGTPTPDNPVMPQGTGERTGNLYQFPYTLNFSLSGSGNNRTVISTAYTRSNILKLKPNTTYYFTGQRAQAMDTFGRIALFTDKPEVNSVSTHFYSFSNNESTTFTTDATENYALVYLAQPQDYNIDYNMMLIEGSTPPSSYIPYGIKIPISSAGQTTPVYLGEVETTRKIKKLVLTGQENITQHSVKNGIVGVRIPTSANVKGASEVICTHCNGDTWTSYNGDNRPYSIIVSNPADGNAVLYMTAPDSEHNTLETFIQWVTNQYNNGTPIEIWYVQQTETTGIVNEPIRKIGDYADTLSMEQAGGEIPTARGTNTLDVLTDVKPSEIYIKYKS